ncbi:MAG: 50S ribosomal protein L11 methyltransferase [Acidobacteriia bacterium]|nr:50S ribosomal protein L11 methyltransferase [Terriglobia bacterium]
MFSFEISTPAEQRDLLSAELWDLGCAGISELDDGRLRVFFEEDAGEEEMRRRYPNAVFRPEEQRDWVASAREMLQPMLVGARFFLVPEWRDDAAPPGRCRISVNPGLAFGTGVHETTQLCLEALEEFLLPGMALLDVGTGSGILGEAATLLGAAKVFACDLDPVAVSIAKTRLPACFVGSADGVRSAAADLVIANISPEAITGLADELMRVLRAAGILVVSGFEAHEVDWVSRSFPALEVRRKGNWAAGIIRK